MERKKFKLVSDYNAAGDQAQAIQNLVEAYNRGSQKMCLLGVTGSGKTYTMASFLASVHRPTLVLTHNKTLAAQLYREFRDFFPHNAVEYFVSYYNYYQPEAYVPTSDTFIEKDASVNEEIERLRLRTTSALLERNDVVIIASISCIYGLGSPEEYRQSLIILDKGIELERNDLIRHLLHIQYQRNDIEISQGTFRVRGDTLEVFPGYREEGIRIEWFGDQIDRISLIHPVSAKILQVMDRIAIYPARHFITSPPRLKEAILNIKAELAARINYFETKKKPLEAERIAMRTRYDIEMLEEMGYCNGIENYSRHLTGRSEGEPPACLLDYFNDEFLVIIDESHASVPQIRGMYEGDRSRKMTLVEHGFRLPSALDNRPLNFKEFEKMASRVIYISATPGDYEIEQSQDIVEQIIRPTGLVDPIIEVRPTKNQIEDILREIKKRTTADERTLITTLTKKMAEDLADYLGEMDIKVSYLHSEIQTIDRLEIIRDLRIGNYDVLVGVNLLREGLDLPEVSLVVILDADKEGFLRNARSLIQTVGRAARNVNSFALFYADKITQSMQNAITETDRRRKLQLAHNKKHNINPQTISKEVKDFINRDIDNSKAEDALQELKDKVYIPQSASKKDKVDLLKKAMLQAATDLDFELAAMIRDKREALIIGNNAPPRAKGKLVYLNSAKKNK